MTTAKIVQNERTAEAQKVTTQPDGPGLRIGKRGEISGIFHLYQVVHVCSENVCHSSKQRLRTGKGG